MIVDVVMLADSKSPSLIQMTQNAIDTLHASETDHQFNVILVESNPHFKGYENAHNIHPDFKFNYHGYMKYGLQHISQQFSDFICLANNDLIFHNRWFSKILEASEALPAVQSFSSFSPNDPWPHESGWFLGYGVGGVVTGWFLTMKREILDIIDLSEDVSFWCSDNIYNDELIKHKILHALVRDSHVTHLGGSTLFTLSSADIGRLTAGQVEAYNKRIK